MIRNTSPVGWIPLLLYKVVYEGSFVPLLLAAIFVALPIVVICILLDSLYFGSLTITSYNFLKINVIEGLSRCFGDDPIHIYLTNFIPDNYSIAYPFVLLSFCYYFKKMRSMNQPPLLLYNVIFYILCFSLIAHKEARFLMPTVPFSFLMLGFLLSKNIKKMP